METEPTRTRGRICNWFDRDGNLVHMTLDVWNSEHELETTMVASFGPFDSDATVTEAAAEMLRCLTAQLELF